jgi:tetratricopeptide (TPR) repeat protein
MHGNEASVARLHALDSAGMLAIFLGDHARAATFIAEELSRARDTRIPLLIGRALAMAGVLSYRRGEYGPADTLLEEARVLLRELVDTVPAAVPSMAMVLLVRGDVALAQESFDRAASWYEKALAFFTAGGNASLEVGGNDWAPIDARAGLAGVEYCVGNPVRAAALYLESLHRARDLGLTLLLASAMLGLGGLAVASGQPEAGARLLGAAEGILASLGTPLFPRDRPIRERALAALTAALGAEQLAAAREMGQALTIKEVVAEAIAVGEAVVQAAT